MRSADDQTDRASRLRADAVLAEDICPARTRLPGPLGAVLLTGATGFLGIHLLADLLRHTSARVRCLVRAKDLESARLRLHDGLAEQGLSSEEAMARIDPVLGDLAARRFGLTEAAFVQLAQETDAVYHNGAQVNFVYSYEMLRAPNVGGTEEALRLACLGGARFHHVSSISVFSSRSYAETARVPETFRIEEIDGLKRGYPESKWVAEQLVAIAAERLGLSVWIHRPGMITGHSVTGRLNPRDRLTLMLRAMAALGVAPELEGTVNLSPVDWVGRAVVAISMGVRRSGLAFHLVAPDAIPWSELVAASRDEGLTTRSSPYHQWLKELRDHARAHPGGGMAALALMLGDEPPFVRNNRRSFECAQALAAAGGQAAPPDPRPLLRTYVRSIGNRAAA